MNVYLENRGINCRVTKFLRKRKTAHRWSTAHCIVNGKISLGALRELKNGKDKDKNVWYKPEWDAGYKDDVRANACEAIKRNAVHLGPPNTVYAEEGYEPDDPHRLPNLRNIPVSKHVYGLAIDVLIDWDKLYGPWSDEANATVAKFGLVRPVDGESWHFELDSDKLLTLSPYLLVPPHKIIFWTIAQITGRYR